MRNLGVAVMATIMVVGFMGKSAASTQFNFEYRFADGEVLSGMLEGKFRADMNVVDIIPMSISGVSYTGDLFLVWVADFLTQLPVTSLDGSENKFSFSTDVGTVSGAAPQFSVGFGFGPDVFVKVGAFDTPSNETYVPSRWSLEVKTTTTPVPGDVDGSGCVDMNDLNIVVSCFGQTAPLFPPCDDADVAPPPDGDGIVNILDISLVASTLGSGCP